MPQNKVILESSLLLHHFFTVSSFGFGKVDTLSTIQATMSAIFERLYQKAKHLTSWVRKQLEIIESYSLRPQEDQGRPYVRMGEIYYAHLGSNIGSEIDKERPVLVFQNNDRFVRQSNMVVIIPISSNTTAKPYRIPILSTDVAENKGITNSTILIQQIRSISKARLSQLHGKISEKKLKEVSTEVERLLYKSTPLQMEGDAQTANVGAAKNVA